MSERPSADLHPLNPQAFLERLLAMLPEGTKLTLGVQYENSTFKAVHYDGGPVDPAVTHISTGLHEPNPDGSVSATKATCTETWCLVLDDVGNDKKVVTTPAVRPTLIVETSPGSEQWAYVYDRHVPPQEGIEICNGVVAAGLSDGFIRNRAHHWWRIPGRLPEPKRAQGRTKPAQWLDWTGAEFDPDGLCEALGVTKDADVIFGEASPLYAPDMAVHDPIWKYILKHGMVSSPFLHSSGWNDVICPNHALHTDTRPWGRYMPANHLNPHGAFMCHHQHCNGEKGTALSITEYRAFILDQKDAPTRKEINLHRLACEVYTGADTDDVGLFDFEAMFDKAGPKEQTEEEQFWARVNDTPEPSFTMQDYLPKRVCTGFFATDGLGKSMWALTLACHVAAGRSFMGRTLEQGRVLFFSVEDPWETLAYRLREIVRTFAFDAEERAAIHHYLGKHLRAYTDVADTRLVHFDRQTGDMTDTPLLQGIEKYMRASNEPTPLVVFDPISDVYADEENVRHKVAPFLRRLNKFALDHDTATLLLGHPAKSADSRYSGSTAWSSKLRSRLFMEENEKNPQRALLTHEKASWGARAAPQDLKQTSGGVWVPLSYEDAQSEDAQASVDIRALIIATLPVIARAGEAASASTNQATNIGKLVVQFGNLDMAWEPIHEEATRMVAEGLLARQPMDGKDGRPLIQYSNRNIKQGLWPTEETE